MADWGKSDPVVGWGMDDPVADAPESGSDSERPNRGFGSALWQGLGDPVRRIGTTAEVLGFDETGEALQSVPAPENYDPASAAFMDAPEGEFSIGGGFGPQYLPRAIVEQVGQVAGSIASRAAGVALGALGGGAVAGPGGAAVGGAAGGLTAPFVFEAAQIVGDVATARAREQGREEPTDEDMAYAWVTAGASGALNTVGARYLPGGEKAVGSLTQRLSRAMFGEGATEAAQSAVQQTGTTIDTPAGVRVSAREAFGEGVLGAGAGGVAELALSPFNRGRRDAALPEAERAEPAQPPAEIGTPADQARVLIGAGDDPADVAAMSESERAAAAQEAMEAGAQPVSLEDAAQRLRDAAPDSALAQAVAPQAADYEGPGLAVRFPETEAERAQTRTFFERAEGAEALARGDRAQLPEPVRARVSDEDVASPIPTELIAEGRRVLEEVEVERRAREDRSLGLRPPAPAPQTPLRAGTANPVRAYDVGGFGRAPEAAPAQRAPATTGFGRARPVDTGARPDAAQPLEVGAVEPTARLGEAPWRAGGDRTLDPATVIPTAEEVEIEATRADPEPTDAQKEAENYRKGHVKLHGMDVSIENAKGSERRGTAPDGTEWSVEMPAHYGYVRRSQGADGDQVDVYIGDRPESDAAFVIDQYDPETGEFDEHKAVLGVETEAEALAIYDAGFSDGSGPSRRGGVAELDVTDFREWAREGDTSRPVAARDPDRPRMPEGFWSYQAENPPDVGDLPAGAFRGTQNEWEKLSPGMRREVARAAARESRPDPTNFDDITDRRELARRVNEALQTNPALGSDRGFLAAVRQARERINEASRGEIPPQAPTGADDQPTGTDRPTPAAQAADEAAPEAAAAPEVAGRDGLVAGPPAEPATAEANAAWWKTLSAEDKAARLKAVGAKSTKPRGWTFIAKSERERILTAARGEGVPSQQPAAGETRAAPASTGETQETPGVQEPAQQADARAGEEGAREATLGQAGPAASSAPEPVSVPDELPAMQRAAASVRALIDRGEDFSNRELMEAVRPAFGGTVADGAFTPKMAYEALELAVNQHVTDERGPAGYYRPDLDIDRALQRVQALDELVERLPTQTRRTNEQQAFQQFSTPPAYAYGINWVANVQDGDRVLEPSAGNGGIGVFAANAGGEVHANELDATRRANLEALGMNEVTGENAEQIGNIWSDRHDTYDVVVMNPPFSAAGQRGTKNTSATGAQHVEQALSLVKPGGRLVAIMGHTFRPSNRRVADFFDRVGARNQIRALVTVKGDRVYRKYGTTYDSVALVVDKVPPVADRDMLTGEVDDVPGLMRLLEGVRNEAPARATDRESGVAPDDRPAADAPLRPDDEQERGGEPAALGGGPVVAPGDAGGRPRPERAATRGGGEARPGTADAGDTGDARPDPAVAADEPGQGSGVDRVRPADGDVGQDGAGVELTDAERAELQGDDSEVFSAYRPQRVRVEGAAQHPAKLVEAAAMGSVMPPKVAYKPKLPKAMIADGHLSEAQLEQVIYAGAAHEQMLPGKDAEGRQVRKGFMIGDGTGVGKTREIAGILMDNWRRGRKKHVLLSKDKGLMKDARGEFDTIGMKDVPIVDLGKTRPGEPIEAGEGVLFATYNTLAMAPKQGKKGRVETIRDWLGEDADAVIVFDESHKMGNALAIKGPRGIKQPSNTALKGVELQNVLPNARVVYASATGASDPVNLAYAPRLGLWGEGTPFNDVHAFVNQVSAGGIAAMEVVARDMKQMGTYMARTISFDGVEYERVTQALTDDQREMYDIAARGWQTVLQNVEEALKTTNANNAEGGSARGAAMAQFWGSHQRFFNQVLTAFQLPAVLEQMKRDLGDGLAPVVQIVNTNDAAVQREVAKAGEDADLEAIDVTPKDAIIKYVEQSFPTQQFEDFIDESGNLRSRPVVDSQDNPVENANAVAMKNDLLRDLGALRLPGNPLDLIIDEFGVDNVAEVTGRGSRIVTRNGERKIENWTKTKGKADANAFMDGKKDILVFSEAGGTGVSYHADLRRKNQKRRSHYVLQAGWRADNALQGLGRTHRSNQASAPIYRLSGTDNAGSKRFVATIARRLSQLGALTKGQRDASGSEMFSATDDLENVYGRGAVGAFFRDLYGGRIEGLKWAGVVERMGLADKLIGKRSDGSRDGSFNEAGVPEVGKFLNRVLSLEIDEQNAVFEAFAQRMEASIAFAKESGTFTEGVEVLQHQGARVEERKTVRDDPVTEYVRLKTRHPRYFNSFETENAKATTTWRRHRETGKVYAFRSGGSLTKPDGTVVQTYQRIGVDSRDRIHNNMLGAYEKIDADTARDLWEQERATASEMFERTQHLITGALLPVWDRLRGSPQIKRVRTDDGDQMIGRIVEPGDLNETLTALGVDAPKIELEPAELQRRVLDGETLRLSTGHRIKRSRVGNEPRIEVVSSAAGQFQDTKRGGALEKVGAQIEMIQGRPRAFIPTGERGHEVIRRFMAGKDIVSMETVRDQRAPAAWSEAELTDRRLQLEAHPDVTAMGSEIEVGAGAYDLLPLTDDELVALAREGAASRYGDDGVTAFNRLVGTPDDTLAASGGARDEQIAVDILGPVTGRLGIDVMPDDTDGLADWALDKLAAERGLDLGALAQSDTRTLPPARPPRASGPAITDEAKAQLRRRLDDLGLERVGLNFVEALDNAQGRYVQVGSWAANIIMGRSVDPDATLDHEAIHALKNLGLFTDQEWNVLADRARRSWIRRHAVRQRWPEADAEQQIEEAVAEEFAARRSAAESRRVRGLLDRIGAFMEAVRNWARGLGFQTAADVFDRAGRSEIGRRSAAVLEGVGQIPEAVRDSRKPRTLTRDQRQPLQANPAPGAFADRPYRTSGHVLRMFSPAHWDEMVKAQNWRDFRHLAARTFVTKMADWRRLQEDIEAATSQPIASPQDLAQAEKIYHGRTGVRTRRFLENTVRPFTREMGRAGISRAEMDEYLWARGVEERNAKIAELYRVDRPDHRFVRAMEDPNLEGGSGFSNAWARRKLAEVADDRRRETFERLAERWDRMNRERQAMEVAAGLKSQEQVDAERAAYRYYVPFRGHEGVEELMQGQGTGQGYQARGPEGRRAMGRAGRPETALGHGFAMFNNAIIRSEKNRVFRTMLRLVQANPNDELWSINRSEVTRRIGKSKNMAWRIGADGEPELYRADQVQEQMQPPSRFDPNVVIGKVGGQEVYVTISNPALAGAMKNLGVENLNSFLKATGAMTRVMSALNTTWNVAWFIPNLARDLAAANIQIGDEGLDGMRRSMMENWTNALRGAFEYEKAAEFGGEPTSEWGKIAQDFALAGGRTSYIQWNDVQGFADAIQGEVTPSKLRSFVGEPLQNVGKAIETFTSAGENGIRIATYKAALDRGVPKDRAAKMARDVTVDFNQRGNASAAVNSLFMFFNAAVQGSARLARVATRRPDYAAKVAAGLVGMGFMEALLGASGDDSEEYERISEWERERNLVVMRHPLGMGEPGEYWKIPLPYGFNALKVLGTEMGRAVLLGRPAAEAAGNTVAATLNAFNPLPGNMFPSVAAPFFEVYANTNFFGSQIKPDYPNDARPPSEQFFPSAPDWSVAVARWLNGATGGSPYEAGAVSISPESIDHVLSFYAGGTGREIKRATELYQDAVAGRATEVGQVPLARAVMGDTTDEIPTNFAYRDLRLEVESVEDAIEGWREAGEPARAREVRSRDPAKVRMIPVFRTTEKLIGDIRDQERAVRASNLSQEEKDARLDRLRRRQYELQRRALERYDRARNPA
jgi:predicted RNA methylase